MAEYFFQESESILKDFVAKVLPTGINYFAYARFFKDQTDSFVTSHANLGLAFIQEKFYERILCGNYDDYVDSVVLSSTMGQDDIFHFYSDHFNIFHMLTVVKKRTDFVEFFHCHFIGICSCR